MCNRYNVRTNLGQLELGFSAKLAPGLEWQTSKYNTGINVAPRDYGLTLRLIDGVRHIVPSNWTLIPSWSKAQKLAFDTMNAKSETVATKPAFRSAYKSRRCLVLATHYIEFEKHGKARFPFRYEIDGGKPFAMAGLWEVWRDPSDSSAPPLDSLTIITTTPNELTKQLHHRMPVIVDEPDYDAWMSGEEIPLVPFPADRMEAVPNTTKINDSKYKGADCIGPPDTLF